MAACISCSTPSMTRWTREKASLMPALKAGAETRRDLLAFLSRLDGVKTGANALAATPVSAEEQDRVIHARRGEWPTYHGDIRGNRYSALNQITKENAAPAAASMELFDSLLRTRNYNRLYMTGS